MKDVRLDITKEFDRNRDADSAYFMVTVTGDGIEIKDEAFNIFSSGTFHLGAELEEKLEEAGIDSYDIVEALENSNSHIIAEVETPEGMKALTKEQLDSVIDKTDKIYDQKIGTHGNYNAYHDIAMMIAVGDGLLEHISQYDARVIDARTEERGNECGDDGVDADLDAYSRRFDCEV